MRFAHLSDSHLGYRQFGIYQREQDFYETFNRTIDKIIELDVDFVIHSGDLFDSQKPSPNALIAFQKGLLKLNEADIPMYAIAGNHDTVLRKNIKPPIDLFEDLGLKIIRHNRYFVHGGIFICGMKYVPSSQKKVLEDFLDFFSEKADDFEKSILVLHQGIDKFMPGEAHELELGELPENFDYYAMGHLHDYFDEDYGRGKLIYPGSTELYQASDNFKKYGKGFCLVDMSGDAPKVERIEVPPARKRFKVEIKYENLSEGLESFKDAIMNLDEKPIVDIVISGGEFETSEVYDTITEALSGHTLILRPSYRPDETRDIIDYPEEEYLDPKAFLKMRVDEEYSNDDVTNLSLDLLDYLAVNNTEDAQFLSDSFYGENYFEEEDEQ